MRAWTWPFLGAVIGTLGCSSSGKQSASPSQSSKAVAEALTTGVAFDHGLLKKGQLPAATATGVNVQPASEKLILQPSTGAIMALDVDNPDEATDPVKATLIQFEDNSSHVEVARGKADAGTSDAGAGAAGKVHLEESFKLGTDVCKDFCNKTFDVKMFMAVMLNSGKISQHATRTFTLDCTQDGNAANCDKPSDAGTKGTAGKPSPKVDAGKRDGAVDLNSPEERLGAAYAGFDKAVCGCSTLPDKASTYCGDAPVPLSVVDCIKARVQANKSMACVMGKVNCDVAAINALATTCASCSCNSNPNQMLGAALAAESGTGCKFAIPGIDTCMLSLGDAGVKDAGTKDAGAKDAGASACP